MKASKVKRELEAKIALAAAQGMVTGFPVRMHEGNSLTPVSGAPYLMTFEEFVDRFKRNPHAEALVAALTDLAAAASRRVAVSAIMIGGSLLVEPAGAADIDCVFFYRAAGNEPCASDLLEIERPYRPMIDARFIPIDGDDDCLTVKLIGYFTLLYAIKRNGREPSRSPLLLRPPVSAVSVAE